MYILETNVINKNGDALNYDYNDFENIEKVEFEIDYIIKNKGSKEYAFTVYDVKNDKMLEYYIMNEDFFNLYDEDEYNEDELIEKRDNSIILTKRTIEF